MAAQSSLCNEDRNLLRIREKERRSQEALEDKKQFSEKTPLFAEPYKTNKEDELSSRIQNMLGNYEEVKEFMSNKSCQNLIGIPKSVAPVFPPGQPDRPYFPEKAIRTLPPSFQHLPRRPPVGPMLVPPRAPSHSSQQPKAQPGAEPASGLQSRSRSLPSARGPAQEHGRAARDAQAGCPHGHNDKPASGEGRARGLQASPLALSPFLPCLLSSPVAPLSPLHSSQNINSRSQNSSKSHGSAYSQTKSLQDLVTGSQEKESRDSPAVTLTSTTQPSSQTFPPSLTSKASAMQQKPTAYVRPMDGQDQAPFESLELKPLLEEYHEGPNEDVSDLKAKVKAELSKLETPSEPKEETDEDLSDLKAKAKAELSKFETPSEPIEQTNPIDVQSIEEILREMTRSWPPPLTALNTPTKAEPPKFPFPTKELQPEGSVTKDQKQYGTPSEMLPGSQPRTSMLQDDLQLSDSEESGDDQVVEKSPSSLAPPSSLQSQPKSVVASAHSSSSESGSTSDSDSSSDSETESHSSSDSEANDPPRAPAPEPEAPTSNKWQLDNWLTKVNPPAVPTESLSDIARGDGREEGKRQERGISSHSSQQHTELREPPHRSQVARAPQEAPLPTKRSCQKPPARAGEPLPRHTVGIKGPSKPLLHQGPRRGLKVESEPGPSEGTDQALRDKPKVKKAVKTKSSDRKDMKPGLQEPSEKKKDKGSHQANAKPFLSTRLMGDGQARDALSPLPPGQATTPIRTSSHRPQDLPKEKLPLPLREKLLSPVRDPPAREHLVVKIDLCHLEKVPQPPRKNGHQRKAETKDLPGVRKQDLKRKAMDTPEESLGKKKRGEKEETDRKKMKSEKETKSLQSSSNKDSSKLKASKASSEAQKKDVLPPLPAVSAAQPAPKSAKMTQKRPRNETELPAMDNPARNKSNHKDPSFAKHRKVEGNHTELSKGIKGSAGDVTKPFSVPSLPNGTSKPRRPLLKFEKQHSKEYYIEQAQRLKHKADAMTDKTGKAFEYLEAALLFIEYGIALESDVLEPKSAYSIFSDTIVLIKFIMTLKPFADSSVSSHGKIFAVLRMRCQSILHMAMFGYKKDTAMRYSRLLNDHFKSNFRVIQAPSPGVARSTGLPSPLSPIPSPAGSVSSQPGSNDSNGVGHSSIGSSTGPTVTVSCHISNVTSSYVNITSYILHAYEIWEKADALARKNKEFFAELSRATSALALTSSLTDLVHYIRQGLQWLRLEANMP
ncbi:AF4/FMR2 family member 1 isoform X2 [Oenanthe melanoleuca]|uniref:AF4/FMR2 family member 1 isoform X2 n=1 Tax=Oenanthe melanoleuca TaxID=2939378 RepID=UPI0024C1219F|nr:AF4/FMR2 family member 1 isoform X2 [Oenanthe melanoleuca]